MSKWPRKMIKKYDIRNFTAFYYIEKKDIWQNEWIKERTITTCERMGGRKGKGWKDEMKNV